MYAKTISIVAVLAFASQAVAEPLGKNTLFVSTRDLFGLEGRSDSTYNPKAAICGLGSDCSACGSSYERCSSDDQYIHCYDTSSNATCCGDGSGGSCESGYYCYPGRLSKTLCCPDGIDADSCKSTYGATLTSILPTSTAASTASSSTATSTSVSTSSAASTVSVTSSGTTSAFSTGGVVYVASSAISPLGNNATNATATYSKSSATATATLAGTSSSASSTSASTGTSTSGALHNTASFLTLFGAVIMAAML